MAKSKTPTDPDQSKPPEQEAIADETPKEQKTDRVNKYLALQLGISRREADEMIEHGSVSINDVTATLGARFEPHDLINGSESRQ